MWAYFSQPSPVAWLWQPFPAAECCCQMGLRNAATGCPQDSKQVTSLFWAFCFCKMRNLIQSIALEYSLERSRSQRHFIHLFAVLFWPWRLEMHFPCLLSLKFQITYFFSLHLLAFLLSPFLSCLSNIFISSSVYVRLSLCPCHSCLFVCVCACEAIPQGKHLISDSLPLINYKIK